MGRRKIIALALLFIFLVSWPRICAQKYRDLVVSCSGFKNSQFWNATVVCICSYDCDNIVSSSATIPGACSLIPASAKACTECLQSIDRSEYVCDEHVVIPTAANANRIPTCFGIAATNKTHVCSGHGTCISQDVCACHFLWDPGFRDCSSSYYRIATLFSSVLLYLGFSFMFIVIGLIFCGWFARCLITCFCLYRLDKRLKKNIRFSAFSEKKKLVLLAQRVRLTEFKSSHAPKVPSPNIFISYESIDPKLAESIVLHLLGETEIDTILDELYDTPKKQKKRNKNPLNSQHAQISEADTMRNATHLLLDQMQDCQSPLHKRHLTVYLLALKSADSVVNMLDPLPFSKRTCRLWILMYKFVMLCTAHAEQTENLLEERQLISECLDTMHESFKKRSETQLIAALYRHELDLSVENPVRKRIIQEVFKQSSELSVRDMLQEKCEKYAQKIQKATAEADTWKTVYFCELLRTTLLENQQNIASPFNIVHTLIPSLRNLIQNNENDYDVCRNVCRLVWEVLYLCLIHQRIVGLAMNADDRDNLLAALELFESKFVVIPIFERMRAGDSLPKHFDRTGELRFFVDLSFQCLFLMRDTRSIIALLLGNANVIAPNRFAIMLYEFRNQVPYFYMLHVLELYSKYWVSNAKISSLINEKLLFNWHTRYLHLILLNDVLQNQAENVTPEQQLLIQRKVMSYAKMTSRVRRSCLHLLTFPLSCCLGREGMIGKRAVLTLIHQYPAFAKKNSRITDMQEFSEELRASLFPNIKYSTVDRVWTTIMPHVNFLDVKLDLTQPQVCRFRLLNNSKTMDEEWNMEWLMSKILTREEQAIFILAQAGDGKTSLLRHLAFSLLKDHQLYGIFVKAPILSTFAQQWKDEDTEANCQILHEAVLQSMSGELENGLRTGLELTQFKIQLMRLLKRQSLYILVDGYDEIPSSQRKAFGGLLQKIRLLRGQTTNGLTVGKLVVTSRDEATVSLPSNMPIIRVELKAFNKKTHQSFLKNVLTSIPNIPPTKLNTVREDIKRMHISNPLLSVLMLKELVSSKDGAEKTAALESQYQLYARLLRSAVSEAKSKRVYTDNSVAVLDTEYLMRAFSILAYVSYKVGESMTKIVRTLKHSESFEEIVSSQNQWLKAVKNPVENFVSTLMVFSSLTVNQSEKVLWSHRSIQHFFVAKFLTDTDRQIVSLRSIFNANAALRTSLADKLFLDSNPEVVKLIFSRYQLDRSTFHDPLLTLYSALGNKKKAKLKPSLRTLLFTTIPVSITQYPRAEQPALLEYLAQSLLQATHMNARRVYELVQQMTSLPDEFSIFFRDIPYVKEFTYIFGHSFVDFITVLKADRAYFMAASGSHLYLYHVDKRKYSATITHDANFTAARSFNTRRGWLVGDDVGNIFEFDQFSGMGKARFSLGEPITSIQVSSDDSRLVVTTAMQEEGCIRSAIHLPAENLQSRLPVNHRIMNLFMHTQNRTFCHELAADGVSLLTEFDLTSIAERRVLRTELGMTSCSKWDQIIVLGFKDGHVELYDVDNQLTVASFTPANGPATISSDGQRKVQHYSKAIQNLHVLNAHVLILLYDRRTIFIRDWMNHKHSELIWKRAIFNVRSVSLAGSADHQSAIDILYFDHETRLNRAIVVKNISEDLLPAKTTQSLIISPQPQLRALSKRTVGDVIGNIQSSRRHLVFKAKKYTISPCISSYYRLLEHRGKGSPLLGYHWDEEEAYTFVKEDKVLQIDLNSQEIVADYPLDVFGNVVNISWVSAYRSLILDENHNSIRLYDPQAKVLSSKFDLKLSRAVLPILVLGSSSPFMIVTLESDGMMIYTIHSATSIARKTHLLQGQTVTAQLIFPLSQYKMLISLLSGEIQLLNFSSRIASPEVKKFVTQANVGPATYFDVLNDETHFLSVHVRKNAMILWNVEHRQAIYSFNLSCSFVCLGMFEEAPKSAFVALVTVKAKTTQCYNLSTVFAGEESLRQFQHIVPLSSTRTKVIVKKGDESNMTELITEVREMKSLMHLMLRQRQSVDQTTLSETGSQSGSQSNFFVAAGND